MDNEIRNIFKFKFGLYSFRVRILEILYNKNIKEVEIKELSELLNVSESIIENDIYHLSELGFIKKIKYTLSDNKIKYCYSKLSPANFEKLVKNVKTMFRKDVERFFEHFTS